MNKRTLIILLIVMGIAAILMVMFATGVIKLPTMEALHNEQEQQEVLSVDDLQDNSYYVWHNPQGKKIKKDLSGTTNPDVFKIVPKGTVNWNDKTSTQHVIWFSSKNDSEIPTLYPGDVLIFVSPTTIPFDGITWERFADYGYTIGVANLVGDQSGHYRIINDSETGYTGYVDSDSDASSLCQFETITNLFLDKIGDAKVRDNLISPGGTVLGLNKDNKYVCEWYTGTYYQDYEMTANVHTFCSLETFTTYDYEFLHSNCIAISIPEWFKTGYYYIQDTGLFRYVNAQDMYSYSGQAYDPNINWNDPIILYDKDGNLLYDPSTGIDKRSDPTTAAGNEVDETHNEDSAETWSDSSQIENEDNYLTEDDSDVGLEAYEEE